MKWHDLFSKDDKNRIALQLNGKQLAYCQMSAQDPLPQVKSLGEIELSDDANTFRTAISQIGAKGSMAYWVLPTDAYRLLTLDRPAVPETELTEALRWQIKDQIDFSIEDAAIDHFSYPEGLPGESRVFAVVVHRATIEQLVELSQSADLRIKAIDISELAMRNLLITQLQEGQNAAYVAETPRGLFVNCFYGSAFSFTRSLNDVYFPKGETQEFTLDELQDELRPDNSALSDRLLLEVQRTLDYYESQVSRQAITRLILADMGAHTESIVSLLQQNLGIGVEAIKLESACQWNESLSAQVIASRLALCGGAFRLPEGLVSATG